MNNKRWVIATCAMVVLAVVLVWTGAAQRLVNSYQPKPPKPVELTDYQKREAQMMAEVNARLEGRVDMSGTLVAVDEAAFHDMMSAAVANDSAALMRLGADGRVFSVASDTPMRLIGSGLGKKRVSILSGPQAGRTGWVAT
jgi:hypothetical protein